MRIECITPVEEQEYLALVDVEKDKVRPEAEAIRTSRIQAEAPRLAEQQNITVDEAAEVIRSRSTGKLQPDDVIRFQSLGNVAVSSILTDSVKYDNLSCADPLEPEEGTCKAKFFANTDSGTPLIHSMLHGGASYYLQHDTDVIPANYTGKPIAAGKTKHDVILELTEILSKGTISSDQWCDALSKANISQTETDGVLEFLASTLPAKKTLLKKEYQEYLCQTGAKASFDQLRETANGKVIIEYTDHNLNEATELAEQAIISVPGNWPYFNYGNVLSFSTYDYPTKHSMGVDDEKPPKVPVIRPYSRDNLYLRIEQSVLHYKVKTEKASGVETPFPIATPQQIVNKLIEHPSPLAPRVSGLVSHPVLAMDGRVIDQEGIDDLTGLLVQFGGSVFHPVPDHITRDDAREAADRVFRTLFAEFCFRESKLQAGLYKSTALAMLQTGIFRKVIDQAPGFLIVANVQGSGKTTLARIVYVTLTGRDMPVSSLGGSAEEMKKEMLATLMQSPAMVCYDNILDGSEINDAILAKAITSPEFKGRILGKTQEATVPTNTVITITGNNVTLSADLVRRFVTVSLTADIAQPENRVYEHPDIVQHCLNNRRDVIRDCLLISKAFIDAGCPLLAEEHGSSGFVQWDRMVRFPLFWATGIDVLQSMKENRQQSTEHLAMIRVLNCLNELFAGESFTASKVMTIIQNELGDTDEIVDSLREGLVNMSSKSLRSIRSLTWVLKKLDGRIIDDMVLHKEQIRNRSDEYRIENRQNVRVVV